MSSPPPVADQPVSVEETFGFSSDLKVLGFAVPDEHVPEIDPAYRFDPTVTKAILAGFVHDRRVLVQGAHGTGKSTHLEQVAARLNWPMVRVNLDGHITRLDLVGRDAVVVRDGVQVTEFREGILPWSLQRPVALVFDELDAGRPDVMFVIQRIQERGGRFTLLDQNRVSDDEADLRPELFRAVLVIYDAQVSVGMQHTCVLEHLASGAERIQTGDSEFAVDNGGLLRPQSGNSQQRKDTFGYLLEQLA